MIAIPKHLLPPVYLQRRHPELRALEDNPVFLQWVNRRRRRILLQQRSLLILFVIACALGAWAWLRTISPQYAQWLYWSAFLVGVIMPYLLYSKKDRSEHSLKQLLAGCGLSAVSDLYFSGTPGRAALWGALAPRLTREAILMRGILFLIVAVILIWYGRLVSIGPAQGAPLSIVLILGCFLAGFYIWRIDALVLLFRGIMLRHFLAVTFSTREQSALYRVKMLFAILGFYLIVGLIYGMIFLVLGMQSLSFLTIMVLPAEIYMLAILLLALRWRARLERQLERQYAYLIQAAARDEPSPPDNILLRLI